MITLDQYWGPHANCPEITEKMILNAESLLGRVNPLLEKAGVIGDVTVTSGFRPIAYNIQIGGSKRSHHCNAHAIDIWDPSKKIGEWCMNNITTLVELGLYLESLSVTHKSSSPSGRWIHLQDKAPRSGSTVFLP